ncbi:tRNA lysidine(34) synthetase TilS [Mycoplasmopsis cricetuli]|uniref:tRNA lysidine(34) synthetase TilS n=1 Tax=Mycoplasmopsis cricetuli TaxID=171283 RepID=UPI00056220D8|nr:tRNA lysidine(34) synthetase TilS [Mycoplasmopsis cricetuli]
MKINNNFIIAVSGGPDSMYLLNKYKYKNPVVAFVNYNQRNNSYIDEIIVENFCLKYNLILEKLILKKEDYFKGNFQNWARLIRIDFFKQISEKYHKNIILVAHHKDDFLESCVYQKNRNATVNYWGIKKKNIINNLTFIRPLLFQKFKKDILNFNIKNNVNFAIDYTNEFPKYERNKIRIDLKKYSKSYKNFLILKFLIKNLFLNYKNRKINYFLNRWSRKQYSQDSFNKIKYQKEVLYLFLIKKYPQVKLNSNKINSVISFILSKNRTSKYLLKNGIYLKKIKGKLIF